MTYQSDRQYAPTLRGTREIRVFMDWTAGAHRVEQGTAPAMVAFLSDSARRAIWSPRGAMLMPAGGNALDERALDAWTVEELVGDLADDGVATIHAALGDADNALACLSEAVRRREHDAVFLRVDPKLDTLRRDARFAALVSAVGLDWARVRHPGSVS
jgi:hypothetical protein